MTKPDLVALAARLDVCASEPSRTPCQTLREAAQALRHLASQPSLYEAGPCAWLRDVGAVASDGQHDECLIPAAKNDPGAFPVYRGALPADGGEGKSSAEDGASSLPSGESEPVVTQAYPSAEATPSSPAGSVREALEVAMHQARFLDQEDCLIKGWFQIPPDTFGRSPTKLEYRKLYTAALSAPVEAPVAVKPRKHFFTPCDDDRDTCLRCGHNVRNANMHCMGDERPETDAQYIERLEDTLRIRSALIATPRPLPSVEVDPAEIWELYLADLEGGAASPQGAIAFAVHHILGGSAR